MSVASSIASIFASNLFHLPKTQIATPSNTQPNFQSLQSEFQQLGQDLQAGNLSQAQSDFAALQSGTSASSGATPAATIAASFKQLSQDLQSGNLSGAQQDYASIQQGLQQQSANRLAGHHYHHRLGGTLASTLSEQDPFTQLLGSLGQSLQNGNLASAQSAYASLQQEFAQLGSAIADNVGTSVASSASLNLSV